MPRPWTVLPHDPIVRLDSNVWAVDGDLPRGSVRRRMVLIRLSDGRLVVHSAICCDEATRAEIEALGAPAYLIVPNGYHRLDAHAYKERYPDIRVLCPASARRKVARVVAVDGALDELPDDPALAVAPLDGLRREAGFLATGEGGVSLVVTDLIMNLGKVPGAMGVAFRLAGALGGPTVSRLSRLVFVSDKRALADSLRRVADLPGLARIVVGHGDIVEGDAGATLRRVADRLAPAR